VRQVKCYRTGTRTAASNSQAIQAHVGGDLAETFGWRVDLHKPLLTVLVYLNDRRWVVGVSVLRQVRSQPACPMAQAAETRGAQYTQETCVYCPAPAVKPTRTHHYRYARVHHYRYAHVDESTPTAPHCL
jgi:hypothetical protein